MAKATTHLMISRTESHMSQNQNVITNITKL